MLKTTHSWINPVIFVGAFFLISNLAYGQEGMRKGKYEEGVLHKESQEHHWGKGHPGMMKGKHHEGHEFFLGMRDQLELTEGQVQKLRALKSKIKKQAIRTKADLEILQIELHDLLSQDKVNVKAADAKVEKMGELQTKMHKAHIHARLDAKNILTAEQLKKQREMKGKMKHGMRMQGKSME